MGYLTQPVLTSLSILAPRVVLRATHEAALDHCSLAGLKRFAVDLA
jgi:uncharacterized protein (DUF2237 family)